MKYALLNSLNKVTRTQEFADGEVPQLAADKGLRWEPYAPTARPSYNATMQDVREQDAALVDGVWTQQWEVYPLPPEMSAANQAEGAVIAREAAKAARAAAVDAIKVTTAAGNTFDGDELSQGRMARAVIALSTGLAPSVTWVLADNTTIQATAAELTEALVLAGQAQASIWVL